MPAAMAQCPGPAGLCKLGCPRCRKPPSTRMRRQAVQKRWAVQHRLVPRRAVQHRLVPTAALCGLPWVASEQQSLRTELQGLEPNILRNGKCPPEVQALEFSPRTSSYCTKEPHERGARPDQASSENSFILFCLRGFWQWGHVFLFLCFHLRWGATCWSAGRIVSHPCVALPSIIGR